MIAIEFNGRQLEITTPEERALRSLRIGCVAGQWVAPKSDFEEGPRKWRRYILPVSKRAKALGVGEEWRFAMERKDREGDSFPKRARAFFEKHPRHSTVITGDPRRINAILQAIDTIRAAKAAGLEKMAWAKAKGLKRQEATA